MNTVGVSQCLCRRFSSLNKLITAFNTVNNGVFGSFGKHPSLRKLHTFNNLLAKISFNLSDIGEGIREVVIKEWFVKVGDEVKQFDNICEVQSDKASVTITSRYDGIISRLYYDTDQTAFVGKPLIDVETDEISLSSESTEQLLEKEAVLSSPIPTEINDISNVIETNDSQTDVSKPTPNNDTLCIPSVRRLAKEHAIDLQKVKGTGKHGRILKEDILKYLEQPVSKTPSTVVVEDNKARLTGFQKAMVKTMTESLKIPQFLYSDEITVTELSHLRRLLKSTEDLKISFLPFFVKAISNALSKYPMLNASLDDQCEHIIFHRNHNIGVAVDTAQGLAVPIIKNVQEMGVLDIAAELQRLLKSGKEGTFSLNDLSGGTFTVSNIGSIGGTYTKPLILPPQVAIVAFGASQVVPRFDEAKNVIPEEIINISVSGDHRIIDGATIARFVRMFKKQLESPYLLFLNI